nr:MmcQ/YjbR family DNA-binding protein [Mobilicoccus massiliensis]
MFDEDDPLLARVRDICLALPDAKEKVSHGRPTFYTTKIFAWYGGSVKVGGAWRQHPQSVLVLLPEDERRALLDRGDTFVPGYVGPSGWIGVDLAKADWSEIAELVEESYRATAGVRRVARLEGWRAATPCVCVLRSPAQRRRVGA